MTTARRSMTVRLVELPTRATLGAAHDRAPATGRRLVYVGLHATDEPGVVCGWGECSALNTPSYTNEWADGAFDSLTTKPHLEARLEPMASAAVAMAQLDESLRSSGESLAARLDTEDRHAPAGAVIGLAPIPRMLDEAEALMTDGFRRLKCKVVPGRLVEPVRAIIDRFPDVEVHVDANGSLSVNDIVMIHALRDLGVRAIEQPFAVGDHGAASRLVAESDITVVADEAIDSVDDLWALASDQAATAVAIKPPRLGGLRSTLDMLDAARGAGFHCAIGGMLESGLGRHQLAAIAPLAPFTVTGDLSPARRWLALDPFADIAVVDGMIAAPEVVGIAGDPDVELLEAHTVAAATVAVPTIVS